MVNHGTIQVDKVLAATLKLDGGTTISGGDLSIGSWGKLEIGTDGSSAGATLDGVAVSDGNAIVIDDTTTSGAVITLTLEHDTTITGGTLRVGEGSELAVENSKGAVLDGVTVTNDGNIEIDPAKATLIADDDTTITDGTMTIGGKGTFDVEAGETNGGGATLDNVDVANCGIVQVENGAILDLKGVTIAGGILNTVGEPYGDGGAIHVLGGDGKSIFDGSANTVTVEGYVQVEANAQLELKGDIDLAGGIIELDEAGHHHGSQLVIDGHVTLTGYGYIALEGNDTGIVGGGEGVATLDNESTIYGSRGGYIGDGGDSLIFINCGTVDSEAGHAGPLVIDTGAHAVINTGILEATGLSELDLYGTYENCGGTIGAYSDDVGPSVVKLFDATIKGGTLATDSSVPGGSMIEVVAGGTSVFDGSHGHAVTVDGYVRVDAGANLELIGTIHNDGMIDVDGQKTDLVIDGSVTLNGGGVITLDNAAHPADQIVGVSDTEEYSTLYNVDNTIEGAGNIGTGDGNLSLVNERCGAIDANLCGQTLTLDTGNSITNWGILEATNGGKLLVQDCVNSCGPGHALIKDGTIEFDAAANINVTFDNGSGYGELILKDWSAFAGQISDFGGTQADAAHSDEVELLNFDAQKLKDSVSYNCDTGITTLTVWDAKNLALTDKLYFVGDYSAEDFAVKQVGNNVQIFDPPPTSAPSAPSVSIGGAGNDTFVFQPGMGAETINNFNPQVDTIELDQFANAQNTQQLAALVTTDAHGDAAIEFGHNDSISIPGMTASYLQAHLQSLVHLH